MYTKSIISLIWDFSRDKSASSFVSMTAVPGSQGEIMVLRNNSEKDNNKIYIDQFVPA